MTRLFITVLMLGGLTGYAATRARRARRRVAVLGRVGRAAPPPAPRHRGWLAALREPPEHLTRELRDLGLAFDAQFFWRVWRSATLLAALGGAVLIGPVFGVLVGALVAGAPVVAGVVLRSRADALYDETLAVALDAAGRSVRSGGSLPQAVAEAATAVRGTVGRDLAGVAAAADRGRPFAEALGRWRGARDRPSVRLAVGALVLAMRTGGPPARVIEDVASAIRVRQQVAREAHALAAQARLSAVVVGVAPLGFMVVTCLTDARNARVLFSTPVGVVCVCAGLALDAVGALWMHRMSAAVAR